MYQAQVRTADAGATNAAPIGFNSVKAPKNGYVYIYVSNRSDQDVYFDNLTVNINTGNIIEENHYYAYGLKIAGISSVKLPDAAEGTIKNNDLYNDKELFDDGGLNWYDYGFRNYDPQTGRFMQLDPLTDQLPILSPYLYAFNDPIANIDKNGLFGEDIIGLTDETAKTLATVTIKAVLPAAKSVSSLARLTVVLSKVSVAINLARSASDLLSTKIMTPGVGDDLSEESLSRNPNFSGVTLTQLRGMVRNFNNKLDQYMINISAGILLEDLYQNFSGLTKNTQTFHVIGPNPNGILPLVRNVIPDFLPGVQSGQNLTSLEGGLAEVKAINDPITFSTSNYQVSGEGSVAARADVLVDGIWKPGNPNAGELRIAAITFIVPSDKWVDNDFVQRMTQIGVTIFISHPYMNIQTGKILFSTPKKLNFISNVKPYSVKGDINGVSPNVEKAAQRWRIDQKADTDDGDN